VVDFQRDVYCLLGLPFDAVDLAGAVRRVRTAAAQRTSCFLSTPNLNFLVGSLTDGEFRDSVLHSDLSIADGMPLVWIARLLGIPIRERVAGATLFESLRRGPGAPLSVFFFGGPDGAAEAACRRLATEGGGLTCTGHESPGFRSVEELSGEETIRRINAAKADFLVVALGARKGQAWIERNRARVSAPVISHLGAVVNFVAGTVRRAPSWMQKTGLEWLWRIKEEPALWRRYLGDGWALLGLLATRAVPHAWYVRRHEPGPAALQTAAVEAKEEGGQHVIHLRGAWTRQNIAPLRGVFAAAALARKDVRLEAGAVSYVDSAFVGLLTLLHAHQRQQGRQLVLASAPKPVRRVIRYCCAEYLLP
jgi:N-acetylglucosaminyldiphosphoundecaprenol N-acetyl-beta-D-mannosaminyltransferase